MNAANATERGVVNSINGIRFTRKRIKQTLRPLQVLPAAEHLRQRWKHNRKWAFECSAGLDLMLLLFSYDAFQNSTRRLRVEGFDQFLIFHVSPETQQVFVLAEKQRGRQMTPMFLLSSQERGRQRSSWERKQKKKRRCFQVTRLLKTRFFETQSFNFSSKPRNICYCEDIVQL